MRPMLLIPGVFLYIGALLLSILVPEDNFVKNVAIGVIMSSIPLFFFGLIDKVRAITPVNALILLLMVFNFALFSVTLIDYFSQFETYSIHRLIYSFVFCLLLKGWYYESNFSNSDKKERIDSDTSITS